MQVNRITKTKAKQVPSEQHPVPRTPTSGKVERWLAGRVVAVGIGEGDAVFWHHENARRRRLDLLDFAEGVHAAGDLPVTAVQSVTVRRSDKK